MYAPQLSTLLLLLGGAAATAVPSDTHFASLLARQAPGTPKYECHFNCGSAISGGRIEGHCNNATWVGYYQECLECALEFDIWQYYGTGVSTAAAACGLSTTPSPSEPATPSTSASVDGPDAVSTTSGDASSAAESETTAAETTAAETTAAETTAAETTAAETTAIETTAEPSPTDVATAPVTPAPSAATTTAPPTAGVGSNSTSSASTATSTFVTVSGALRVQMTASLLGGAVLALGLKALW